MIRERWIPNRKSIEVFIDALSSHSKVQRLEKLGANKFRILREAPLSPINAFLVDVYTVGHADVVAALSKDAGVNAIITMSAYNGYTRQAKEYAKEQKIGVYVFAEFLGALWKQDHWSYVKFDEEGKPITHYHRQAS